MSEMRAPELSQEDRDLLDKLLKNPLLIPESFRGWLQQHATLYAMPHIQELAGYRSRRWRVADPVAAFETATSVGIGSGTLQDLTTDGPVLERLEKGTYASLWGYYTQGGGAISRFSQLQYNAGGVGNLSGFADSVVEGSSVGFDIQELTEESNTIKQRYAIATDNQSGDFGLRWLASVRIA